MNKHGYSCYDKDQAFPLAAKLEVILRETGDLDKAKALFNRAVREGMFDRDGHHQLSEKLACLEVLHLADLGYSDFQPKPDSERNHHELPHTS